MSTTEVLYLQLQKTLNQYKFESSARDEVNDAELSVTQKYYVWTDCRRQFTFAHSELNYILEYLYFIVYFDKLIF